MPRTTTPWDFWQLGMATTSMLIEAQTVIAYRTFGMLGLWPVAGSETARMVMEKPQAFALAWMAGAWAGAGGASPVAIGTAVLAPVQRATSANARRLSRRRR